jgi:thiol-disulfide isomerase/thioredoxin
MLDDEGLARVADYLATRPKDSPTWADSDSKIAKSLRGRLQVLQGGKLVAFDPGARPEPQIYLVYFGAHWCRPCRQFSPSLLAAYRDLKKSAPDRFELVFVSNDHDSDEQKLYVGELGMPWPVLKYSSIGSVRAIERWAGPGIPCLVVLTRDGDVIFHSYHGSEYVGPEAVLRQFEGLLPVMGATKGRAFHRLAVVQYLRSQPNATVPPKPYFVELDRSRYQTLEVKRFTARLDIDKSGHVTHATFEPQLPVAIDYQLTQDAESWLFLPSLGNGRPRLAHVELPIVF